MLDGRTMIAVNGFKDLPPVPHIVDKVAPLSQVLEIDITAVVGH
jgi:hypothetical protein